MPLAWAPIKDSWAIDQKRTRKKNTILKIKKNETKKKKRKNKTKIETK